MKRLISFVILCVTLGSLVSCGEKALTWQEQYDLGVRYLSEGNYEEAIIAFTAAIEIDPKLPEAYLKAAETYVELNNFDAAISILEQGYEVTADSELRAYLEKLQQDGQIRVVTYQAAYRPDGSLAAYAQYYYNEEGYQIRYENYSLHDGDVDSQVETWEYDGKDGHCWYTPDRGYFQTDEEWEAAKEEQWNEVGTWGCLSNTESWDYSACVDPLIWPELKTEVIENDGVLYSNDEGVEWFYAVYTFNEDGDAVAISSFYEDGTLSATAIIEWAVITPPEKAD